MDVMEKRAEVNLVHVTGLGRTKDLVVAKIIEKVFGSKTFGDIVNTAGEARQQLKSLGLSDVNLEIDTAKGGSDSLANHRHDVIQRLSAKDRQKLIGPNFAIRRSKHIELRI